MIPQKIVEYIGRPVVMFVGTRDENLNPHVNRVMGAIVEKDKERITFYVAEVTSQKIRHNLDDNGRIALTMSEPISHESYQFKGSYLSSRESEEGDIAIIDEYVKNIVSQIKIAGGSEEFFNDFIYNPSLAITFQIEDIFNQTPGPGAGKKITE